MYVCRCLKTQGLPLLWILLPPSILIQFYKRLKIAIFECYYCLTNAEKKKTNRSKCKPIKTHTCKHKDYSEITDNCLNAVFNSL